MGVLDTVDLTIYPGVGHGGAHVLQAHHPLAVRRHEVGDGAGARVQIVNVFLAGELRHLQGRCVESLRLLGVGLIERLGTNAELQLAQALGEVGRAAVVLHGEVVEGIVFLGVDHVLHRREVGEGGFEYDPAAR